MDDRAAHRGTATRREKVALTSDGSRRHGKAEEEAMKGEVAKYVLLDTGFWIGLLDARDGRHAAASIILLLCARG